MIDYIYNLRSITLAIYNLISFEFFQGKRVNQFLNLVFSKVLGEGQMTEKVDFGFDVSVFNTLKYVLVVLSIDYCEFTIS